jgi:hypothetical protein
MNARLICGASPLMHLSRLTAVALVALAAACAATAPAGAATACGQASYAYAGVASVDARYGIGARISTLSAPSIAAGHIAGWVGVGGSGLGPAGSTEWLQAGISVRPGEDPALYYEVALPGAAPRYVMLKGHLPVGRSFAVAVLESRRSPGVWSVWVNGSRMTGPIRLPGSHGIWRPMATAESWDGDETGTCNTLAFKFSGIRVAAKPGGAWQPIDGRVLADAGYRVQRTGDSLFVLRG